MSSDCLYNLAVDGHADIYYMSVDGQCLALFLVSTPTFGDFDYATDINICGHELKTYLKLCLVIRDDGHYCHSAVFSESGHTLYAWDQSHKAFSWSVRP